ncbi:MAG TPA: hypothetical protein PK095_22750, partial [Myxococcota bacterium]|nr:hypothetical protein [Myxococcota bacterium]
PSIGVPDRLAVAEAELTTGQQAGATELILLAAAHHERAGDDARARELFQRWRSSVPFPELAFDSLRHDPDAGHLARWLETKP